jgi:hypothetical protein
VLRERHLEDGFIQCPRDGNQKTIAQNLLFVGLFLLNKDQKFITSYLKRLPILVVVALHYFVLGKGEGRKSVHDALAVFGEIIVEWLLSVPLVSSFSLKI